GDPRLGRKYDALSGARDLGFDENHAHVQPEGTYHYHGLPTLLLDDLGLSPAEHSPLVGWAADGFPIYAMYGYKDGKAADSEIVTMTSSYELKSGNRPGGEEPDGEYDGTFVRDYEYVEGAGSLVECNGRMTVAPDVPDGTYAYFLTADFPIVPRCFRGTPSQDFAKRGGSR
ncbi:MAG: YHYH protein, partial [Pleurocapsa sp.]